MLAFRQAQANDLPILVQLLADDPLGKQREDARFPLPEAYFKAFQRIDQDPNQELMVFLDQEAKIAGMFQLSFLPYLTYRGGIRAQIEGVRIRRDLRGQGHGTEVFTWAIRRAKERGAHLLQLTTDKQRPEALQFYRKLGFVASHEGLKLHL
ncbi:MAG: GNAT family N-acetyltransferase [Bacteroidota bacterium]